MTILKTTAAAFVAGTIAFGAMAPMSTPAFASDQGFEVPPVKQMKQFKKSPKKSNSVSFVSFDKKTKKKAKYLVIGAAVGAIGYALIRSYED